MARCGILMWHEKHPNNVVAKVRLHSRIYCVKGCTGKLASAAVVTMSCQEAHLGNVCRVYTQLLTQTILVAVDTMFIPKSISFLLQPHSANKYVIAAKYKLTATTMQ